ncbi:hypothetical protein BKA60DRAFT_544443 [Fusarium oxysporum]|nr:hypothetical protein BKA60DRAFT_544443 [Fusarium oxysporum]
MVQLSTDAIITLVSTIPGLIVSCLSAWFAYLALQRRPIPQSDIETAAMLFMIPRTFSIPPSALSHTDTERTLTNGDVLQLPPTASQHCLEPIHNRVLEHAEQFDNALLFSASTWAAVHTTQLVSPSHCPSPDTALSLGSMDKLHPFNNQPDATVHYDWLSEESTPFKWTMTNLQRHNSKRLQENGFIHLKAFLTRGHFLD